MLFLRQLRDEHELLMELADQLEAAAPEVEPADYTQVFVLLARFGQLLQIHLLREMRSFTRRSSTGLMPTRPRLPCCSNRSWGASTRASRSLSGSGQAAPSARPGRSSASTYRAFFES